MSLDSVAEVPLVFGMSRGMRVMRVVLLVLAAVIASVSGVDVGGDADAGLGLGPALFSALFALVLSRGTITCDATGIHARNLLLDLHVPWRAVREVVARDLVVVVTSSGAQHRLWAVQRARIAMILNRRSVVDDVVERIESVRPALTDRAADDDRVVRRPAWPSLADVALVVALAPGAFVLGMLV